MVLHNKPASSTQSPQGQPADKGGPASKAARKSRKRPMTPQQVARLLAVLDKVIVLIVLILAFFLASFAVRNSDFWMHLASGRLLAERQYVFGVDPFSYTTEGVYWVNHAWMFDWLLYRLFVITGGVGVVLVKAVLVVVLAIVLLSIRRSPSPRPLPPWRGERVGRGGQNWWLPAGCTGLALLALSPGLVLQPAVVSFLFLAVTIWLLTTTHWNEGRFVPRLVCFMLLFAFWVNLDGWFFLGPVTVALFLLGSVIEHALQLDRSGADVIRIAGIRRLVVIVLAGTAACLLNPHGYHAFSLPAEISFAVPRTILERDPQFQQFFLSPLDAAYFRLGNGLSVAGFSYYILAIVSLTSFVANWAGWRGWRIAFWLGFLLLSFCEARTVPFFALVAGPIMLLNWQDYVVRRSGPMIKTGGLPTQWPLAGRAITLGLGVALLVAAWPGWLQTHSADPQRTRRVAWKVEPDPSLQRVAEARKEGRIAPGVYCLNLTPEAADYLAWYCPGEKSCFDQRFQLFGRSAADYVTMRRLLFADQGNFDPQAFRNALKNSGERCFLITLTDPSGRPPPALAYMLNASQDWPLLYMDGRTFVFGRIDQDRDRRARQSYLIGQVTTAPAVTPPGVPLGSMVQALAAFQVVRSGAVTLHPEFKKGRFNANARAFGRDADKAPTTVPDRLPHAPEWWESYARGSSPRPLQADEAAMHLFYYRCASAQWQREQTRQLRHLLAADNAGIIALTGVTTDPWLRAVMVRIRLFLVRPIDNGPPGSLLLAVRAARQAVAANPDDATSHATLAKAYDNLWYLQEGYWQAFQPQIPMTLSLEVRRSQFIVAAQQALALDLDAPTANAFHGQLYHVYRNLHYDDLAIEHLEEVIKHLQDAGSETPEAQAELDELEKVRAELQIALRSRHDEYLNHAQGKRLDEQVRVALQAGLAKEALRLIEEVDSPDRTNEEVRLRLFHPAAQLLLRTGQIDKLRHNLLYSDQEESENPDRDWYIVLEAAATGDYTRAGQALDKIIDRSRESTNKRVPVVARILATGTAPQSMPFFQFCLTLSLGEVCHELLESQLYGADHLGLQGCSPWKKATSAWPSVASRRRFRLLDSYFRSILDPSWNAICG